ncbi:BnaCnng31660D [Brassica napus]|uniref:BnaCnng31660D protein n=1 Tax=Brassica napus TaxID=3708 RepID=A0A078J3S5_BRANA|nr:BnaCnng31660D [Brassica napus]
MKAAFNLFDQDGDGFITSITKRWV